LLRRRFSFLEGRVLQPKSAKQLRVRGHDDGREAHSISTSIFTLPDDFDEWPNEFPDLTADDIGRTRSGINARQRFLDCALGFGYSDRAV
jgi:hypothetical protein